MPEEQQSPSRKQKFLTWVSSLKRNLPPALVAAESTQLFHPVNTAVARMINADEKITTREQFNKAVFCDLTKSANTGVMPDANLWNKFISLNKGWLTSAVNSGATKTFRYLTQDQLQQSFESRLSPYTKNYMDENQQKTFAGGVSGGATGALERLMFHPLDTRKVRQQVNTGAKTGLYSGLGAGMLRDGASAAAFFGSFNLIYNSLKGHSYFSIPLSKDTKDNLDKLNAAGGAGMITAGATHPLFVVKTQMQAQQQSNGHSSSANILSTMKESFNKEGLKSLVNGNLLKGVNKALHESTSKGVVATGLDIYAKKGFSGLFTGVGANVGMAPLRSTIPYFVFLFGKKKWDTYLENQQRNTIEPEKKTPVAAKA